MIDPDFPSVPYDVAQAIKREERRHLDEMSRIINRWPQHRADLAYALLGGAIAVCDSFGLDVMGFLSELRRREPMPPVLSPPTKAKS